ncbi:hypothetical protein OG949_40760 (plasmid) [Streptomyces scopuliridis]|uniref:hypothetical protein n=1 Tax=Streptomyces scopuliridis TaxID=452529 RepID=UPI002DDB148A|nr:hypothetical protein [Streptomyces scopuliridis]WSB39086.1 hypothetical protein OG949_40760 [Streptomyces scopuliridis]
MSLAIDWSGDALNLLGPTPLERIIRGVADHRGIALSVLPGGTAELECPGVGRRIPVPSGTDLARELVRLVLAALTKAVTPSPARIEAMVLRPAGGVCGPAAAGPVDAVRLGGTWTTELDGAEVFTRFVDVQNTRCWLAGCTFDAPEGAQLTLRIAEPLLAVDDLVAQDTARLTQYLHDRGEGALWPHLVVLGRPEHTRKGGIRLLLAFTERRLADELICRAMPANGGLR